MPSPEVCRIGRHRQQPGTRVLLCPPWSASSTSSSQVRSPALFRVTGGLRQRAVRDESCGSLLEGLGARDVGVHLVAVAVLANSVHWSV